MTVFFIFCNNQEGGAIHFYEKNEFGSINECVFEGNEAIVKLYYLKANLRKIN